MQIILELILAILTMLGGTVGVTAKVDGDSAVIAGKAMTLPCAVAVNGKHLNNKSCGLIFGRDNGTWTLYLTVR